MGYTNNSEPMRYYQVSFSISEIINQIYDEIIILNKSKYRMFVWDKKKKSLFIDSIIRGFPTPSIFLYQESDRSMTIIDGVQRLHTIMSFSRGEFRLNTTSYELNGKSYEELSYDEQYRFKRALINVILVEEMFSDTNNLTELFYRLNIGGEKITNQEFRNRLYYGDTIEFLNELNSNLFWRKLYGREDRRLKDIEYILKFMTYLKNNSIYSYNQFMSMNDYLEEYRNNVNSISDDGIIFSSLVQEIYEIIGVNALKRNNRFSSVLFDLFVIPLGVLKKRGKVINVQEAYENVVRSLEFGNVSKYQSHRRIHEGIIMLEDINYDI